MNGATRASGALGVLLGATAPLFGVAAPSDAEVDRWRIYTERAGIHRVAFEDLPEVEPGTIASVDLGLEGNGREIPIQLLDGGDGDFGPGDSFIFAAEISHGERTHFHEYSKANVYVLALDGGRRYDARPVELVAAAPTIRAVREHFEHDELLARIDPQATGELHEPDVWYWSKLSHADREPLDVPFEIADPAATGALELRLELRGLSRPTRRRPPIADHRVDVWLNYYALGSFEWDHRRPHQVAIGGLDPAILKRGANLLQLRVPPRVPAGEEDPLVDVQLLNWLEVAYPRVLELSTAQAVLDPELWTPEPLIVGCAGCRTVRAFSGAGGFWSWESSQGLVALPPETRLDRLVLLADDRTHAPEAVEPDRPSNWRDPENGADYLMIGPARLLAPAEPLADLHRRRGLRVETVEVQDVYDEFNHGIAHPRAIRALLLHARESWRPPAPRFVLLVGDASWDFKNPTADDERYANRAAAASETGDNQQAGGRAFTQRRLTPYRDPEGERNLVPTWTYHSHDGHSASDNGFVTLDGGHMPTLAIGRFPVVEPAEVRAIVDKTVRYIEAPPLGDWRRRTLWITSDDERWQQTTDELAAGVETVGFRAQTIYPTGDGEESRRQESIRQALTAGQLLVHFIGHGGRFVWRTGPLDTREQQDLFSIEHIDALPPSDRLPVVLSMTCFSAPFDHPTANSIGERFLAAEGRGAIAVIAASWRNTPALRHSKALLQELLRQPSVGEALLHAKIQLGEEAFAHQYHLLGDPALPLPEIPARAKAMGFLDPEPR